MRRTLAFLALALAFSSINPTWAASGADRPDGGLQRGSLARRGCCISGTLSITLRGLEPSIQCMRTDLDSQQSQTATGRQLGEEGIALEAGRPSSAILRSCQKVHVTP